MSTLPDAGLGIRLPVASGYDDAFDSIGTLIIYPIIKRKNNVTNLANQVSRLIAASLSQCWALAQPTGIYGTVCT